MSKSSVGVEVELNLIDYKGYISNTADVILKDKRNPGCFVAEATLAQVEYNSTPAMTITELAREMRKKLGLLETICADYDVVPVAASEYGAGKGVSREGKERYDAYDTIIGRDKNLKVNTISGIHIHLSQEVEEAKKLAQFQLLYALDPMSYGVTSTSPLRYDGLNSLNCHRIQLMRHDVFSAFPLHAQLQEYPRTWSEIEAQNRKRFGQWQNASGMVAEKFSSLFTPENTGYAPIRAREGIGPTGTFEIRTCDSTPLQYALGVIALYKGCNDRMSEEGITLEFAQQDNEYEFSERKIMLPTLRTLKMLEQEAIQYGMTSDMLQKYVGKVVRFAEKGLTETERGYLEPIIEMVQSGINPSTSLNRFLRQDGYNAKRFTPERAAEGNIFLRELYKQGL